jgi:hypothetical protein
MEAGTHGRRQMSHVDNTRSEVRARAEGRWNKGEDDEGRKVCKWSSKAYSVLNTLVCWGYRCDESLSWSNRETDSVYGNSVEKTGS